MVITVVIAIVVVMAIAIAIVIVIIKQPLGYSLQHEITLTDTLSNNLLTY